MGIRLLWQSALNILTSGERDPTTPPPAVKTKKRNGTVPMENKSANNESFKILRAVDPSVIGGTKPLMGVSQQIHFPNAQGGLRRVDSGEIRNIARDSAKNLLQALKTA